MDDPRTPDPAPEPADSAAPTDDRAAPPAPASVWVEQHPPTTEAEREAAETVRSISRLEESN